MMKILAVLTLLLCSCVSSPAQILTIRDAETNYPLEMATLTSKVPRAATTTDSTGRADVSAFRGSERIEIRFVGYKTEIKSFRDLERTGFELFLTPAVLTLDQVVVSATRWSRPAMDTPERIAVVSPENLFLQSPQTAADLLATSGEVYMQKSQQGGGSPMIRGFATNRLLYAVDGVRMNTAIFRSGNIQNVISLDPFAIENTEVMFGPGSVLYGSDAIGGVMSFQTITPLFSLYDSSIAATRAVIRTASANSEMSGHVDLNLGWTTWALATSLSYFSYGDLMMGRNGPDEYLRPSFVTRLDTVDVVAANENPRIQKPTGYTQFNVMQKIRFIPENHWDIQFGFHYSATSNYSRYDRLILSRNGLPRSAEWYYGPQLWMMNNFTVLHDRATTFFDRVTARFAHQFFRESRNDRDLNSTELRKRAETVNAWSVNVDLTKSIGMRQELLYGVEAVYDDVESEGTNEDIRTGVALPGPTRYPQSAWSSYALYASYRHRFSDRILGQAGLRYNRYNLEARFDTTFYPFPSTEARIVNGSLTGSLGIVYHPTNEWSLSASLATGFRSPNVDDMGKVFDSEPGFVVVPNPDLSAEHAYNLEVGIAKIFGGRVKLDFAAYYTLLNEALVRRNFRLNGLDSIMYDGTPSRVQAVQNAARAFVYGIQAGIEVKLPSGFGFTSHLNYQKGEEELDDGTTSSLRHAAPLFGSSRLTYSSERMVLELSAIYNAQRSYSQLPLEEQLKPYLYAVDSQGRPYSPAWYTLNFRAMVRVTDVFTVSGGMENITDNRYRPYSSGIAGPGRNFVLTFKAAD